VSHHRPRNPEGPQSPCGPSARPNAPANPINRKYLLCTAGFDNVHSLSGNTPPPAATDKATAPTSAVICIGYLCVTPDDGTNAALSLVQQRIALEAEAHQHGWHIQFVSETAISASAAPSARRELGQVLKDLRLGNADVLLVTSTDRLSRSLSHFDSLQSLAEIEGWKLISVEHREQPTGKTRPRVGGAVALPDAIRQRIFTERQQGRTLQAICDGLITDQIPTALGGKWAPATISTVLSSVELDHRTTRKTNR
jgi:Resolvase, N terminal domain/Recombinase